jgi:hypothetical protein
MSDIRVIAVWEEDGKSWRERYEELKASCVAKPQAAPDKIGASGEATEPVIISTLGHIGIISTDSYRAIYDAAPCKLCGKLLKSENPENKCRCGE